MKAWRRLLVPVLALFAINAAVFGVWTLPRLLQARSVKARSATLQQELAREQAKLADLRARAEGLGANLRDEERFRRQIAGDRREQLVPMLQDVVRIAQKHGLRARTQSYDRAPVKGTDFTRFGIHFPVEGSYAQLAGFVQEMERSPHFVTLDSIGLAQRGEEEGGASLDLQLSAYFRTEPDDEEAR